MKKFFKKHKFKIILVIISALFLPLNIKEYAKDYSVYEIVLASITSLAGYFTLGYFIDLAINKEEK